VASDWFSCCGDIRAREVKAAKAIITLTIAAADITVEFFCMTLQPALLDQAIITASVAILKRFEFKL